jgi:hypothetical protein
MAHSMLVAANMPTSLSTRPHAAPRIVETLVGSVLEVMIHAVETWRERRTGVIR